MELWLNSKHSKRFFLSLKHPYQLWGPHYLLFIW